MKKLLLALALGLLGCGEDVDLQRDIDGAPERSAILLAVQVYSPESYLTYVGAVPEIPVGEVDLSRFREFGNANASTYGGHVFVEEEGLMTRFSVDDRLELVEDRSFSWRDFGVASINGSYTVFVSERRAYTFAPELGLVIVWDPEAMTMTGTLSLNVPERPAGMTTYAYDGHVFGDKVVWNVISDDWEAMRIHPAVTLAITDAHSDGPVEFVEDDRCIPGGPSRVDEAGDYYVHAGAEYGYFAMLGDDGARTCMLRVKAGEASFDPDFVVDYEDLTGTRVTYPWIHVTDSHWVTYAWDPSAPFLEDPSEFWDNTAFRPLLVDTAAGTARPYPDLEGGKQISGIQYEVDGTAYFEFSRTGYVEGGSTDVVALSRDGAETKFHVNGFLLGLERIR